MISFEAINFNHNDKFNSNDIKKLFDNEKYINKMNLGLINTFKKQIYFR